MPFSKDIIEGLKKILILYKPGRVIAGNLIKNSSYCSSVESGIIPTVESS